MAGSLTQPGRLRWLCGRTGRQHDATHRAVAMQQRLDDRPQVVRASYLLLKKERLR